MTVYIEDEVSGWMASMGNSGRWADGDQPGCLSLISSGYALMSKMGPPRLRNATGSPENPIAIFWTPPA